MKKQYFYLIASDKEYKTFEEMIKADDIKYTAFSLDGVKATSKELELISGSLVRILYNYK